MKTGPLPVSSRWSSRRTATCSVAAMARLRSKRSWAHLEDLIKNIHGVAPVAELDGDEIGFLVAKVAEIKSQR